MVGFGSEDRSVPGTIPAALTKYVELQKVQLVGTTSRAPAVSNHHRQCEISLPSCRTNPCLLISLMCRNCKVPPARWGGYQQWSSALWAAGGSPVNKSVSALSQPAELDLCSGTTVCVSANGMHGGLNSEDLLLSLFLLFSLARPRGHS